MIWTNELCELLDCSRDPNESNEPNERHPETCNQAGEDGQAGRTGQAANSNVYERPGPTANILHPWGGEHFPPAVRLQASRLVPLHRRTYEHPSGIDNSVDCSRTIQTSLQCALGSQLVLNTSVDRNTPERTKIGTTPNQPESSIASEVHTGSPSRRAALRRHHCRIVSTRVSLSRNFIGFLGQGPWGEVIVWCIANSELTLTLVHACCVDCYYCSTELCL